MMGSKGDVIDNLAVKLTLDNADFSKKMKVLNKEIIKSKKEFRDAGKGVKNYEKSFIGLANKLKSNVKQLDLNAKKLQEQEKEYKDLSTVVNDQKNKLDQLEKTVGKGSKEWEKQAKVLAKNADKLSSLNSDINKTKNTIDGLTSELTDLEREFNKTGKATLTVAEQLEVIARETDLAESELSLLGGELEKSGSYFKKLGNEMDQIANKLNAGKQKMDVYGNGISKLAVDIDKGEKELKDLKKAISETELKLQQAKSEYGENSEEVNKLRIKLGGLKDEFNKVEKEVEENKQDLNQYQRELNETTREVNELTRELKQMPFDKLGDSIQNAGNKVKGVGQTLTAGVTMPLTVLGGVASKTGMEFEYAMADLQATAGIADRSSDSFIKLKDKALEMGSKTSFSARSCADGLKFMALAGWDVEESLSGLDPMLKITKAGNMELQEASDLVTDSLSSLGLDVKDLDRYLNTLAQTQRSANASVKDMLDAYVAGGGIFKSLNMPLDESATLLGVLANRGKKGAEAGNALISVFSNIITETGQAGNALNKLNISLFDGTGKQKSMVVVLKEMAKKLGVAKDGTSKLTDEQKAQYSAMIGGKTQYDTLMALLAGVSEEYDELHDKIKNSSGALDEINAIMDDTTKSKIESMKSAIEGALIKVFEALQPVIEKVANVITTLAEKFTNLDSGTQATIIAILGIVAVIPPLLIGLGQVIFFAGVITKAIGATGLTGALGVLAGPVGIGLAIGAIALLCSAFGESETAIYSLQDKLGGLGTFFSGVMEFIAGVVQLTLGNVAIMIMGICNIIGAIIDGPGGLTVKDAWSGMCNSLTLNIEESWSKIFVSSTRGMSQLQHMTAEELTTLVNTSDEILKTFPIIVDGNYADASSRLASQLTGMSNTQLNTLSNLNDTNRAIFQGINDKMTVEQKAKQIEKNLSQMSKAGKLDLESLQKDASKSMDILKREMSQRVDEGANNVNKATEKAKNTSTQNLDNLANNAKNSSDKVNQSFNNLGAGVDRDVSNMNNKVSSNVSTMSNNVSQYSSNMERSASNNARTMSDNVSSYVDNMRRNVTSDWSSMRASLSNTIHGRVVIDKTTYTSTQNRDNTRALVRSLNIPLASDYVVAGSYFNPISSKSIELKNENSDLLDAFKKVLSEVKQENTYNINLNIDKVDASDFNDVKSLASKINIELQKMKNIQNKRIGGVRFGY